MRGLAVHLAVLLFCTTQIACTNIDLDPLGERYEDNISGNYTAPANIDPAGTNAFTFAVLSDTHIGSPGGQILKPMLSRIQAAGDAFVVLCGDVTDSGQEGQYLQLTTILGDFGIPYRIALGNHDIFFGGWKQFRKFVGRSMYSFDADNVHFAVIDSANGIIGEKQLKWLDEDLSATGQTHKIVISHFPPFNKGFSSIFKMSSEEETAILKDLLVRNHVNLMFTGHYHGYEETTIGGVKYIITGGANELIDPGNKQHYFRVHINGSELDTEYVPYP